MLIDFQSEINKLNQVRTGQIKEGLGLGVPSIDEFMRFKYGSFNVILGHSNVGKTTVILYLMLLYSLKHKLRWLVYSSENEPHSIIRKLVEFLEAKPINKVDADAFRMRVKWIQDHFRFMDTERLYTFRELLGNAEKLYQHQTYHGFMIDPYNSLTKDQTVLRGIGAHEYDYQATSEIRLFCKKNSISVWLNTHSVTEAQRMKHEQTHIYAGHPMPPMSSHAEGGSKFVNRCDDFLVIHRYTQHPTDWMQSNIIVRKVKDIDTGGRPTPIDSPILLRSMTNNVGFEMNGQSLIETLKIPF